MMGAIRLTNNDKVVVGLAGVMLGTSLASRGARGLRWHPVAISLALYVAGRVASQW